MKEEIVSFSFQFCIISLQKLHFYLLSSPGGCSGFPSPPRQVGTLMLLQSINLSLIFQEFLLKMKVTLPESLTKSLCSEQQPSDYQTIDFTFIGQILWPYIPCFPPGCQIELASQPNTKSVWQLHWGAKRFRAPNQTRLSAIAKEGRLLIPATHTCKFCRNVCSPTFLSSRDSSSEISLNHHFGGSSRPYEQR